MEIIVNGKETINLEVSGKGIMNAFKADKPTFHLNLTRREALKLRNELDIALRASREVKNLRTEFKLKAFEEPLGIEFHKPEPVRYTPSPWSDEDETIDETLGYDVMSEAEQISRDFWNETEKRERLAELED